MIDDRHDEDASQNDDPRVFAAVQEYMSELEAGRRPRRSDFLARHREIADQLGACLDGLAFVHSAAGQMAGGASAAPRPPEIDHDTAQPLGDFRLVRQIGRGGMGVVYEAVQLSLGRRVALKVLPMAAALDARHLERFKNEASAAAQLHHTNIVPVYAVGNERSVHFYAMQLIEGRGLDEVIRELRKVAKPGEKSVAAAAVPTGDEDTVSWRPSDALTGPAPSDWGFGTARAGGSGLLRAEPSKVGPTSSVITDAAAAQSLTTLRGTKGSAYARSVASLGLQIADALAYAHRAGVVHRDIKPANLLLDAAGTLWVTDFGLAQFYTDANLTRSGDLVGTLRYMSPEQASGRAVVLDQRTDIYSLGVTLYELLTLERALPGRTHEELLREIVHHEPRPPRSIDKTVPRELEVILAKAYAKDAAERYQSAGAMADDLRRFLRDEPILARAPSAWDQAVKWTRRHKSLALSAVTVLALAAIGLGISNFLVAREQGHTRQALIVQERKTKEADREREEARRQQARAEQSGRLARQAVQSFANIAALEMDQPQFSELRREMLEEALNYYQTFIREQGDDPAVSEELAAARQTFATFYGEYTSLDAFVRAQSRVSLLGAQDVQADLGLTVAKAAAIRRSLTALTQPMSGALDARSADMTLSPADRKLLYVNRVKAIESGIEALLGEAGARRLLEIQRQSQGLQTFGDPDVAEALGLTRDQKLAISRLQGEARAPRMSHGPGGDGDDNHGGGGPGHGGGGHGPPQTRAVSAEKAIALLTPDQLLKWKSLVGAPFKGDARSNHEPDFFGGGPGHDGDRGPPPDGGPPGPD